MGLYGDEQIRDQIGLVFCGDIRENKNKRFDSF